MASDEDLGLFLLVGIAIIAGTTVAFCIGRGYGARQAAKSHELYLLSSGLKQYTTRGEIVWSPEVQKVIDVNQKKVESSP